MRFDTAIAGSAQSAKVGTILVDDAADLLLPPKRKVRGRDDLDKVHKVEIRVGRHLLGAVEGVEVVVDPRQAAAGSKPGGDIGRKLGAESKRVDGMAEVVLDVLLSWLPVALEIVHVVVPAAKASAGRQVEVSNNLVHSEAAFNAAALSLLFLELLRIVFALALFDAFAASESPSGADIGISNFLAGVAAALLLSVRRGVSTVTGTAVVGSKMDGDVFFFTPKEERERA